VVRAQHGDPDAFSSLALASERQLSLIAQRILRDQEVAADAVQDTLLRAWLDVRGLRDPGRFDPWLRRILVRTCYRAAARRRSRALVEAVFAPAGEGSAADIADDTAPAAVARHDQLERALRRLSADHRASVVLCHYAGLSLPEAADALGVPTGTVKSRLNRALATMRASIEADDRLPSVA